MNTPLLSIHDNIKDVLKDFQHVADDQIPFATSLAINRTTELGRQRVMGKMVEVFDRPTPWVINSLRVIRSTKQNLNAEVGFKDRNSVESSKTMVAPHVYGGSRSHKAMEVRLWVAGLMPQGYYAVPGAGAQRDAFGNMTRGQITQMLNVLGTYREAGYNKADARTVARLAKGNAKKGQYGFAYWVNPVGGARGKHLPPGVYQRVTTPFGSSLKPILLFVQQVEYQQRLPFYEEVGAAFDEHFDREFAEALDYADRTALIKTQPGLF